VIVSTPRALQTRVVPRRLLEDHVLDLRKGAALDVEALSERLVHIGFQQAEVAGDAGTFARRGGILDLFPAGRGSPVRIGFSTTRSNRSASSIRVAAIDPAARSIRVLPQGVLAPRNFRARRVPSRGGASPARDFLTGSSAIS
jgi:transcription-repair coupling factor (superfamily II helicase)